MEEFADSIFQDIYAKYNNYKYLFGFEPRAVLLPLGFKVILLGACRYVKIDDRNATIFGMEIIETPTRGTISQIEVV